MRIDSHHSFSERYSLDHLGTILKRNRFEGSIVVVPVISAFPEFVRGVVVQADLGDPQLPYLLDTYQRDPRFKGICHRFSDGLPDGLAEVERRGIPLDVVGALSLIPGIVERFPSLRIVIDHLGLGESPVAQTLVSAAPRLISASLPEAHNILDPPTSSSADQWAHDLALASQFPQVFCKLSGVARLTPSPRPYVQHALAVFGPGRLMFGSDWPESLPDITWKASLAAFTQAIGAQTIEVREELLGGTAERFYGL